MRRRAPVVLLGIVAAVGTAACSGDDGAASADVGVVNQALCLDTERADRPVVDLIPAALAAMSALYGSPPRYFEISADRQRIALFVALDDGGVEVVFYCGEQGRTEPEPIEGAPEGATFPGDAVDIDPDSIFARLDAELDDPDIVDFAVVGAGGDEVVYDATVLSGSGGTLLVLLAADGEVLAVQAQ